MSKRQPSDAPIPSGIRVLLAEDSPINQEVAVAMLERLGCDVHAVEDGQKACLALRSRCFDLVLMDCRMAGMDGYEATRAIRRWERESASETPVPIVALTGDSFEGDRERCLDAGMNDFLSKPYDMHQIQDVLRRYGGREGPLKRAAGGRGGGEPMGGAIDPRTLDGIRALPGGDRILERVIDLYLERSPGLLGELGAAVLEGNGKAIWEAAHSLKSSSSNVGALRLAARCGELEALGRDGTVEGSNDMFAGVEREHRAACAELAAIGQDDDR